MKIPTRSPGWSLLVAFALAALAPATGASSSELSGKPMQWLAFPHPKLELRGLPWFQENAPELWRLPKSSRAQIPSGVWNRAIAPDGGRIRFSSSTSRLAIQVQVMKAGNKPTYLDAYIDDGYAGSARAIGSGPVELELFAGRDRESKNITIYLPNNNEVRVLAVGVDRDATLGPAPAFAARAPIVCYGSSVLQGTGSHHPAKTYPAVMARRLNLDFVNLGFGGAGKAEPDVVALVNQLDASCFIFDLGKSYGNQTREPFARMLATIRAAHPTVPIICVTPIYSTKEIAEAEYREKSVRLRNLMREAAVERRESGDALTFVVEGLELFGPADQALFRDPQHPNDEGNELMAARLVPMLEQIVLPRK
jgi:lysophospholipase L1-like esterase